MDKILVHILIINPYLVGGYSLGGAKRIFRMARHLSRTEKVSLACFADLQQSKIRFWQSEAYEFCHNVITVSLQKMSVLQKGINFFLGTYPANVYFHRNEALKKKIHTIVKKDKIDFIHVEFFEMGTYVEGIPRSIPRVIVSQEVLSIASGIHTGLVSRFKNMLQSYKLREYEKQISIQFDRVYCITEEERDYFKSVGIDNSSLFPHVVDTEEFKPAPHGMEDEESLLFLGNFNHKPNLHAARWFLKEVFPLVEKQCPKAVLHLVGANLTTGILKGLNTQNVRVHGEVEDIQTYYDTATVFVNPIISGGGMRGKVLEAMSKAKAVVSTPLGLMGIIAKDQEEVLVASTPLDFANSIISLFKNPEKRTRLGVRARAKVSELYDERRVFDRLLIEYRELLREKEPKHEQ